MGVMVQLGRIVIHFGQIHLPHCFWPYWKMNWLDFAMWNPHRADRLCFIVVCDPSTQRAWLAEYGIRD